MKLSATIDLLYSGGPGSGCRGPNCGRPEGEHSDPTIKHPGEIDIKPIKPGPPSSKPPAKYHPDFGKGTSKKVLGIWVATSTMAHLYKTLMIGDWKKVDELKSSAKALGLEAKIEQRLQGLARVGKKLGNLWSLEYRNGKTEVRMVMHKTDDGAKGNVDMSKMDDLQKVALKYVQKLIGGKGLEHTFSKKMLEAFMKEAGVGKTDRIESAMAAWRGSPHASAAQYMRKVALDYYGRSINDEFTGSWHSTGLTEDAKTNHFDYKNLQQQMLAVKSLSTEYVRTAGVKTLYRGLEGKVANDIQKAIESGKAAEVPVNSLASWSVSPSSATKFGSVIVRIDVDPEDVWVASGAVGHLFGSFTNTEKEYVVGHKEPTIIVTPENVKTYHHSPKVWP